MPARRAMPKMAIKTVGSPRAAIATSRLEPMPPNALPASRPASARKNVPSKKRYIRAMMFPMKPSGARVVSTGTMSADNNIVVRANTA